MKLIEYNNAFQQLQYQLGYTQHLFQQKHHNMTEDPNDGFVKLNEGVITVGGNDGIGIYMTDHEILREVGPTELDNILLDLNIQDDVPVLSSILVYNAYTILYNIINKVASNTSLLDDVSHIGQVLTSVLELITTIVLDNTGILLCTDDLEEFLKTIDL